MRKKQHRYIYIDYDYEAAYTEQIEKLEADQIQRLIRSGHSVYATKEIRSGDQLEVEIYPEFTKEQRHLIPKAALEKRQRAQRNLDEKNSRKACERKINANFGDKDIWATLTYDEDKHPESMAEATRDIENYLRRLNYARKKLGLGKVDYIRVVEEGGNGHWHHHLILRGDMSMDLVEEVWKKGGRNHTRRIQRDDDGLTGMAKYITKEKKNPGQKKWACSKGLKEPEITKNHYKFRKKAVDQMARDRDQIEPMMLTRYGDQYEYARAEVRYNEFNGRIYIAARLHLKQTENRREAVGNKTKKRRHRAAGSDQLGKAAGGKVSGT